MRTEKGVFMFLKNNKGFSLVEVLIASGILGAMGLYLASFSKQAITMEKKSETSFEINSISSLITQSLLNKDSCLYTLGDGSVITNGKKISVIKNRKGDDIFNTSTKYGNNSVSINDIEVVDVNASGAPGENKYGEIKLQVTFLRTSKLIQGSKTTRRSFPVSVELDASNKLVSCFSSTENSVVTAKEEACNNIGGIFDKTTDKCDLKPYHSGEIGSDNVAVSSNYLFGYHQDVLNSNFVNVEGDTMTGKLIVENDVQTKTQICVNGRCRNFDKSLCPTGQVVKEINENGTVTCANVTCPDPNTFYVGIDGSGNSICKAFPTNTCSTNQYVSKVNADGSVQCSNLPPGTNKNCYPGVIQRIDGAGNHYCATIPEDKNVYGRSCSSGQYLSGFSASGNPICGTVPTPAPPPPPAPPASAPASWKLMTSTGKTKSCNHDYCEDDLYKASNLACNQSNIGRTKVILTNVRETGSNCGANCSGSNKYMCCVTFWAYTENSYICN